MRRFLQGLVERMDVSTRWNCLLDNRLDLRFRIANFILQDDLRFALAVIKHQNESLRYQFKRLDNEDRKKRWLIRRTNKIEHEIENLFYGYE